MYRRNATWNMTSEKFIFPLQTSKISPGLGNVMNDAEHLSAFVIRWDRADSVSKGKWSCDAVLTEDITIGTLSAHLPYLQCYGNKTCGDVDKIVTNIMERD